LVNHLRALPSFRRHIRKRCFRSLIKHIGQHRLEILGEQERKSSLSFRGFAGFGMSQLSYENIDLEYSDDCEKLIIKVPEHVLNNARELAHGRFPETGIRFTRAPVELRLCPALINIMEVVLSEIDDAEDEGINPVLSWNHPQEASEGVSQ